MKRIVGVEKRREGKGAKGRDRRKLKKGR